jgi:predicted ATPase
MIGLTGANGTGKTTLAKKFAQEMDIPFVQTSASGVFKLLGLDPSKEYPIQMRLAIQEAILSAFEAQWSEAHRRTPLWISDRTPIDLASYMLADVQRDTIAHDPEFGSMINDYAKRCIESANRWFSTIFLVQPGIPVPIEREGKAKSCPAYMEHLNALALGLMKHEAVAFKNFYIPRRHTDLDTRVLCIANAMHKTTTAHMEQMETSDTTLH